VFESVFSAVRTDSLYKADCACFEIAVLESVYSAVRSDCLYKKFTFGL